MQNLLYLTGVGDERTTHRQERFVAWRGKRVGWNNVVFFDSKWTSLEPIDQKLSRLEDTIASLGKQATTVLAISAGATELVYLFHKYPELKRGITFAGAPQGAQTIGAKYHERAPQLEAAQLLSESIIAEDPSLFAGRITVYRPLKDEVVARPLMSIGDASFKTIPMVGHVASITTALLFQFPRPTDV